MGYEDRRKWEKGFCTEARRNTEGTEKERRSFNGDRRRDAMGEGRELVTTEGEWLHATMNREVA
jgi:hypothetical protein